MNVELVVLRIIHIYGAVVWAGTSLFVAFFLLPAMGAAGPAGAPVMGALVKRKLFTIIPIVAVITMLAGLRMLWLVSGGFSAQYFASRSGRTYATGAVFALATFVLFMAVNHPAIGRMMQLGQQMAIAPEAERPRLAAEMNAVRARAGLASKVAAVLITITVIAMAVGRYL
jgi:uncharacterized membrane protein